MTSKPGSRHYKPWLASEISIVRAHYPAGGPSGCATLLNGRSAAAIKARAHMLGVGRIHFTRRPSPRHAAEKETS